MIEEETTTTEETITEADLVLPCWQRYVEFYQALVGPDRGSTVRQPTLESAETLTLFLMERDYELLMQREAMLLDDASEE